MKIQYSVPIAMLAGIGIGAVAVHTLHAQAKPPVYVVSEIDVTNVDAYAKEYLPVVRPVITKSGGKLLAASQKVTMLEGTPQNSRVVINVFDTLEKAQAQRNTPEYGAVAKLVENRKWRYLRLELKSQNRRLRAAKGDNANDDRYSKPAGW
jgi:uncharacterized protein (DUF1330 family)